jgi:hypothetical protein
MSVAIAGFFPRLSLASIADIDALGGGVVKGIGLLLSLSVLILDQYVPGEWF